MWADPAGGLYANRNVDVGGRRCRPRRAFRRSTSRASRSCTSPTSTSSQHVLHVQRVPAPSSRRGPTRTRATCRSRCSSRRRTTRRPTSLGVGFVTPVPLRPGAVRRARRRDPLRPAAREADHAGRRAPRLSDARGRRPRSRLADARRGARQDHVPARQRRALPDATTCAGHPSLAGRVLFTSADPGNDDAAFIKLNELEGRPDRARASPAGYVVRTRADARHARRRASTTRRPRDAAIASGAQWVSTDYPVPNPAFGTGYFVEIPDGHPARCNPLNAPYGCSVQWRCE